MLHERLMRVVEPAVEALGYELVLLEFMPHQRNAMLRLFIDSSAGISLEDCERVSREVAAVLDVEDPITQAYRLEVSSPGVDRPLVKPEHYQRFCGEIIQVQMLNPVEGRRKFRGVLLSCIGGVLAVQVDSGTVELPLTDVEKARLVSNLAQNLEFRGSDHE